MIALLAVSAWARPPHHLSHQPEPAVDLATEIAEVPAVEPPPAEPVPAEPTPAAEPLYDALIGDAPAPPPSTASVAMADLPSAAGLWPLGVALVGAGAVWVATRKRLTGRSELVSVVGRSALANNAGLVVVDVKDPTGRTRRLVIGTGGSSPPTLVADLGEDGGDDELEVRTDPVEARPERPRAARSALSLYAASPASELDPDPPAVQIDRSPAFSAGARQKAQAMALIGEVVQSRLAEERR